MTDHANELRRYSRKIGHPAGDVPSVMRAAAGELLIVATAEVRSTDWLPIPCGHTTRATDAACEGCVNRGEK